MAKNVTTAPNCIKIGGFEMLLRPKSQNGSIPESRLRQAVMQALVSEQSARNN